MKEMVGGCCVCSDERGWPENPLVYCDGSSCTVAVHQACYGIVTVPTGPWFCRKCESNERPTRVRCELCPTKDGALKKTDSSGQGWAHVVCALYIPEVRFGNVTTMEPIILQLIPPERYAKTCYICNESGKPNRATVGACMQCNKTGCKQQFHVTCAQQKGLLCEEAGNYLDNVKYCGYCSYHYGKLKKGGNVKPIPPYRPQIRDHSSGSDSCSSPEKELEPPTSAALSLALATSATSLKITTNSIPSATSSSSSSSNSVSATKQRKTSNTTKPQIFPSPSSTPVAGPASTSGMNLTMNNPSLSAAAAAVVGTGASGVPASGMSASGSLAGAGANFLTNPTSSKNSSSNSSSASSSSKDKEKHSKNLSKASLSKDKDKDKDSSSSSSSSSSKTNSKSKSKEYFVDNGQNNNPTAITSAIVFNALGQPVTTGVTSASGPTAAFNESSGNANGNNGNGRSGSTSSKKRKADSIKNGNNSSDSAAQQLAECVNHNTSAFRDIIKDVSVTLVPLPLEKIEMATSGNSNINTGETSDKNGKKPKTEASTSPNQSSSSPNEPNIQNVNPNPQPLQSTNKPAIPNISTNSSTSIPGSTSPYIQQSQVQTTDNRQSPRNQINSTSASPMIIDHSGSIIQSSRASVSPNTTTLNDGGLKIAYEKNRINQIQDHEMTSGRRSRTPDSGVFSQGPHPAVASVTAATNQYNNSNGLKFSYEPQIPQGISDDMSVDCRLLPTDMKYSPPSSPGSEAGSSRKRVRKSLESAKEGAMFTNGGIPPHMLGNQINPASGVSQKLSDQLKMEIQDHSIFNAAGDPPIIGVPFPGKMHTRNSLPTNLNTGGSSIASMLAESGPNGSHPQTLEELLERQWENGSRFLMDQAQHFDIATLLSCLYELRTENSRLEDHVNNLKARRDHLLALNARLQIPLSQTNQQNQAATINNLHLTNGGGTASSLTTTTASLITTTTTSSTASTTNDGTTLSSSSYPTVASTVSPSVTTSTSSSRNNAQGSRYNSQTQRQQIQHPPQQPSPLPHTLVVENGIDYRHTSQAASHPSSRQHSNSSHSSSSSSQHHHHNIPSRHPPQQFHHHAQPPPTHHHLPSEHHHMRGNSNPNSSRGGNVISSNSSSSGGILNAGSNGPRGGLHPEGPTSSSSYHSAYSHQASQLRRDDNRKEPS
ncbi:MLLT6.2 family protein [Megaselia abdita]